MQVSCRLWVQGYNKGSFGGGKKDDHEEDEEEEDEGVILFYLVAVLCMFLYSPFYMFLGLRLYRQHCREAVV